MAVPGGLYDTVIDEMDMAADLGNGRGFVQVGRFCEGVAGTAVAGFVKNPIFMVMRAHYVVALEGIRDADLRRILVKRLFHFFADIVGKFLHSLVKPLYFIYSGRFYK